MNLKLILIAPMLIIASGVTNAVMIVSELTTPGLSSWGITSAQNTGGTSEIVSLVGLGGNLENNAPLSTGALQLTTVLENTARAEVGLSGNFGLVSDVLNSSTAFSYDYFRTNQTGGNAVAAPTLKLGFFNGNCAAGADWFFQLIFEPYVNPSVVDGDWASVNINFENGGFWTTGGFGLGNTAGGTPYYTIAALLNAVNSDFAGATLSSIGFGLGTFNPGVTGYVDNVSFTLGQNSQSFDFEVATSVSAPGTLALFGLALIGLVRFRKFSWCLELLYNQTTIWNGSMLLKYWVIFLLSKFLILRYGISLPARNPQIPRYCNYFHVASHVAAGLKHYSANFRKI